MKLTQRITVAALATALVCGGGLVGATAAQAGPSDGTGISTHTTTYPDGVKLSTVAGFSSTSSCDGARSAKANQLRRAGYTVRWLGECYSRSGKFAYQVIYR
jgi:hypothetical protein